MKSHFDPIPIHTHTIIAPPLVLRGGRIIDPCRGFDAEGDLLIADGKITANLSEAQFNKARVIDVTGMVVCPGFVDLHTHLREPGDTHKESIATGTRAAAAGGYTSVVCMPNTKPPADNPGTIQLIKDAIARTAVVNVFPTGCLTVGRNGESLAPIGSLQRAGVVAVTDGGHCIQNNELMRRAIEYAAMFGLIVMDHCEDATMTMGCHMNEGEWSLRLGLRGMPNAAEDIMVSRNVILSHYLNARVHLQQISSSYAVDVIRRAKQRGVKITAEVCPHHIALTEQALADYDPRFKMVPPLRSQEDREALIEGLRDGTLDCVATAHAPHTEIEKDKEFDFAPFGVTGLETALPVVLDTLYHSQIMDLPSVLRLLTSAPAQILGLNKGTLTVGADADVCIFNPDELWTPGEDSFFSLSHNSPWLKRELRGRVRYTLVAGHLVHESDSLD